MKKENKNSNVGLIALFACGILTIALIVACVFFPDELFGLFTK